MASASTLSVKVPDIHFTTTLIVLSTRQVVSSLLGLISSKLVSPSLAFDTSHLILSPEYNSGLRWDAIHFVSIGKNGYEFEQQLAFMPGWPFLMRFAAEVLALIRGLVMRAGGIEGKDQVGYSDLVKAGNMINIPAAAAAAMFLYK